MLAVLGDPARAEYGAIHREVDPRRCALCGREGHAEIEGRIAVGEAQIRVLVVEDEAVNRDVVCQMLSHYGHQVMAVDSGHSALNAVRNEVFDLVMMDCRMDDMDGLETTRRLRAGDAGPRGLAIPVIALTAQAFDSDRDACLAAGMNDFVTKPIDPDALWQALARWIREHGQRVDRQLWREPASPGVDAVDRERRLVTPLRLYDLRSGETSPG